MDEKKNTSVIHYSFLCITMKNPKYLGSPLRQTLVLLHTPYT